MSRKLLAISIVLILALALVTPALAITFGQFDGNDHPYVGSMVFHIPDRGYFQWCSGTLIAPKVFLTASHCTVDVNDYLARYPGSEMLITFDPQITAQSTYYTAQFITNPAYGGPMSDTHDVAVALLDEAPGISPAQLPEAGLLDKLKAQHVLDNTLFTAVGFGTVRNTIRTGPQGILDNAERRQVDQYPLSLTDAWITLSMNPSTGNGGTCYGDSGGPHFIHLNGHETKIVAAITVTGDAVCKATDKDYRMDTESARSFLGQFVALP